MKEIQLSQDKVALVDDADYEYLNKWNWYAEESHNTFYAVRNKWVPERKKQTQVRMHRFILGVNSSDILVDHKDRNGLNNQRSNLREATNSQQAMNKKVRFNSMSKYRGVVWYESRKKWGAKICKENTNYFLGLYKTELDAAKAYNKKAIELHGEFANLNIISAA